MVNLKIYKEARILRIISLVGEGRRKKGNIEREKERREGKKIKNKVKECRVRVRVRICMCVCARPHLYVRASVCALCACETARRTHRGRYEEQRESCLVV